MGVKNWYDEVVVPRLIRCACGQKSVMKLRREVVPKARGRVFEIGCGGGLNQQYYDATAVTTLAGIDPSAKGLEFARVAAADKGLAADLREGAGEAIPFRDASFDCAVCTFTLCSVADPSKVLSELRRIIVPGGRLLFLEHGASPDASVAKWQQRIEPIWTRLAGGCHLTRPVSAAISAAGFDVKPAGAAYMPKTPRWAGWVEWGEAVRVT